jgi:DNA end-binding protein Ku
LTVTFGLVAIPVKLYTATSSKAVSFNLLHKGCGSRLKQQYLCAKEGVVVPTEDMVKGYEFAKDQYVMFTPDELKALEEAGSRAVEITEFVPIEHEPIFSTRPTSPRQGRRPTRCSPRRYATPDAVRSAAGPATASSTS